MLRSAVAIVLFAITAVAQDTLGLQNGFITFKTSNFDVSVVKEAQVLASLNASGSTFDFMPFDYLSKRARNAQYHLGDITYRYRADGGTEWTEGNSALARNPVQAIDTGSLAASNLAPTLPDGTGLNVTREWIDVSGDLGLRFSITNNQQSTIEIGSLGFPIEFNSIFSNRMAVQIQQKCSLVDPYIGMHAGHLRVTPISGVGAALIVTPLGDTPMEAYRNLAEEYYDDTRYGTQTFEGLYEWQVLTKAWAENEWKAIQPWNVPSSRTLEPGNSLHFGLRFSVVKDGISAIDAAVKDTGIPSALGIPGYIIPRDSTAKLYLTSKAKVQSMLTEPARVFAIKGLSDGLYVITPSETVWGRVRLTITYEDGKIQTIHYYVTKAQTETISDLGNFLTTAAYYTDTSDLFGRAPSVITYDYEEKKQHISDDRVWVAGLSDEAGTGAYLAAASKQAIQPNAEEVSKLEAFLNEVVWGTIQVEDYGVKKSIFYYDPEKVPGYVYDPNTNWNNSWNKEEADRLDRAYNYVHVAAAYWSLYRAGRAYPDLLKIQTWEWYLDQSYKTVLRCMRLDANGEPEVDYSRVGLMGETVFGEILSDLEREGKTDAANQFRSAMQSRAAQWDTEEVPFGSEMAWDSTGQEGVYFWTKYFDFPKTVEKSFNTVLGFMPTVPHWGWNGNARRYWDNLYAGKLRRIERQIHHYGSGLNALVLLSQFRTDPANTYALRVGFGGISGPLSNINEEGFPAASFHSWPDTLKWDGITGDYGPNFLGMVLGSATYVSEDADVGLNAYGGILETCGDMVTVQPRDPIRRKVFIGPLAVQFSIDAGIIQDFCYLTGGNQVSVTLSQLACIPKAESAIMWIENTGSVKFIVTTPGLTEERGGWKIPFSNGTVTVELGSS